MIVLPVKYMVAPQCPGIDYRPWKTFSTIGGARKHAFECSVDKVCPPCCVKVYKSNTGRSVTATTHSRDWNLIEEITWYPEDGRLVVQTVTGFLQT